MNEEIATRLRAKITETYEKLEKHYGRKFERARFDFAVNSVRITGQAQIVSNRVHINMKYLLKDTDYVINQTVPHEIAHCVCWMLYPQAKQFQGYEWKSIMLALGLNTNRCHELQRPNNIEEFC